MSSTGEPKTSRKERREEAREARKALEAQATSRAVRQRRMIQLGGLAVVAVVVVVLALVLSGGGKSTTATNPNSKQANSNVATVSSLLAEIPQSAKVIGNPKAPVTLQYFGDLECPICKQFSLGALPSLITNMVRPGKLKIEYRSMETATREPQVFREQQAAALAVGRQNLMWYYVELFYHEQGEEGTGYVTPTYLQGLAKQVPGLNLAKWESERTDPKLVEAVEADETAAGEQGFNGTPSFLLGKTGGSMRKITELSSADLNEASALFEPAIEKLLKA